MAEEVEFEVEYLDVIWVEPSGEESMAGTALIVAPGENAPVTVDEFPATVQLVLEAALRFDTEGAEATAAVEFEVQDPDVPEAPVSERLVTEPGDPDPDDPALLVFAVTAGLTFEREGQYVAQAYMAGDELGEVRFMVALPPRLHSARA